MNDEQNHYCRNLIEVNKKQKVITNQPIYNEYGVLLLAQGSDLDEKRAEVLLQHKLMKPLEQCVGISDSLSARELFDFLTKFASTVPELFRITNNENYQRALRMACIFYEKYPLLQQNLTVLALRAPSLYHQGLFSAMAGLGIGLKMNLPMKDLQTTFIAGLFHDVGFLYLAPELREKHQNYTSDEWKALQAHPLIAQRFLSLVPDLPKEIGLAIVDHHERIDGTGYPRHLFGDKLSMASQIIAATDNILFNHKRYKMYGEHTHKLLTIALKLCDNVYFESVHNATMILLQNSDNPENPIEHHLSVQELLTQQKQLQDQFGQIKSLAKECNNHSQNPLVRSINLAMGRLAISVIRSGILQPEQQEWMNKFTQEEASDESMALIEIGVMHDQIVDQLIHIKNMMERVIEGIPANFQAFKEQAEQILTLIDLKNTINRQSH